MAEIKVNLIRLQRAVKNIKRSIEIIQETKDDYKKKQKEAESDHLQMHYYTMVLFCDGQIKGLQLALDDLKEEFTELEYIEKENG